MGKLFKFKDRKTLIESVAKNPCTVSFTVAFVCVCVGNDKILFALNVLFWSFVIWV